ncbi:MAG TPA: GNAT family N-acetyltransferase [Thermomicrobiales bacterium]|nr:GNAT family N-acetyltransferase [Thermomicrobiales bacterium]
MHRHDIVASELLDLVGWSLDFVDALIANDEPGASAALNIVFPQPFAPPPETGDVLGFFRTMTINDRSEGLFVSRMIVRRSDRMAVGSIGVVPPDEHGLAMIGYSIYPEFEGLGYASEAATALVTYALNNSAVSGIWATIAPDNIGSAKVASRAGLLPTGEMRDDEGLQLAYWERLR